MFQQLFPSLYDFAVISIDFEGGYNVAKTATGIAITGPTDLYGWFLNRLRMKCMSWESFSPCMDGSILTVNLK